MSVAVPVIDYIDGATRRIYLLQGVDAFHWIEDIYREYVNLRATDESLRKWSPFMNAKGNEAKGGGKYTPRYVTLLNGCRVIPYDENILINITGEAITDNADVDPDPFDTSTRVNPLKLYITPPAAEIVRDVKSLAAIARMSFTSGNSITVDPINGHDIATFTGDPDLLGNSQYPVNNLADARTISDNTGIRSLVITSDMTITGVDLRGFTITAINPMNTLLTIDPSAELDFAVIQEVSLTGTLDNKVMLERCFISGLEYFNGLVHNCSFDHNPVKIRGTSIASFYNCFGDSPLDQLIEFDCAGSSAPVTIRNFSGCAKITNRDVYATTCVNFTGEIVLDATCTDNTTGDAFVEKRKLTHPDEIADRVWNYLLEAGISAAEVMRIKAAALAGKASGAGTGTVTFKGLDGTTSRIVSAVDGTGNRTAVTVNGN